MNLFVGQLTGNNQRDANMYKGCNELLIKRLLYIYMYLSKIRYSQHNQPPSKSIERTPGKGDRKRI